MRHYQMILVVSTIKRANSVDTMTVTCNMVLSGETATLTCSVAADNGETLMVK